VGVNPIATVLRDLNNDGILDVAVANKGDATRARLDPSELDGPLGIFSIPPAA
jgi:hypothetical protein